MAIDKNQTSHIQQMISNDIILFETFVLYAVLHDPKFWNLYFKGTINIDKPTNNVKFRNFIRTYNDFTKPVDNLIYNLAKELYIAIGDSIDEEIGIPVNILTSIAKSRADDSSQTIPITSADVQALILRLKEINDIGTINEYNAGVKSIVEEGWSYWLNVKRVKQLMTSSYHNTLDADTMIDQLKSSSKGLATVKVDKIGFKSALKTEEDDSAERMPTGMPKMDAVLRGGLKRGETMLIVSPPAGGKTVIGCQIGAGMALYGAKVCYITTEQPADELTPRIVSNYANILFETVVDGVGGAVNNDRLTEDELMRLDKLSTSLENTLSFENWCDSGDKIDTKMEKLIEIYKESTGLDVVILDWLGGGIDRDKDPAFYRFYLQGASDRLKTLARKYRIGIIALAQAAEGKCDGIVRVTSKEISESKELHQPYTWGLGISCLKEPQKKAVNTEEDNTKRKQYFNWFKVRKGRAVTYPVERKFEYQKFVELDSAMSGDGPAQVVNLKPKIQSVKPTDESMFIV